MNLSLLILSISVLTAKNPICFLSCAMVVNFGVIKLDNLMSSNPITETCSGTLIFKLLNPSITPIATTSAGQTTAVG